MEDLMATGLTGKELYTDEEKFVFTEDDESLKLAISGFVRKNDLNIFAEDENLKVNIDCKYVFYDYELYKVTITFNKTPLSNSLVSLLNALQKLFTSIGNWPNIGPIGGVVFTSPAFA